MALRGPIDFSVIAKVMRKIFAALAATILRVAASLGMLAILARVLPLEIFSSVALGLLVGQVMAILIDGGINNEILRFVGVETLDRHEARLIESVAIRLVVIPFPIFITGVAAAVIEDTIFAQLFALAAASALVGAISESFFISLRATGRYREELLQTAFMSILMLTLPWFAAVRPELAGLLAFLARAFSIIPMIHTRRVSASIAVRKNFNLRKITHFYLRMRYYSVDSLVSNLSVQLDGVIVAFIFGKGVYAPYQPSSRICAASLSIASIVAALAVPVAAKLKPSSKAWRYLLVTFGVAGAFAALLLYGVLRFAVPPIFGKSFEPGPLTSFLLAAITFLRFSAAGSGFLLTLHGHQKNRAQVNFYITCAAVSVIFAAASSIEHVLIVLMISQGMVALIYAILANRINRTC